MNIPKYLIIHHTASDRDKTTLADVDAWHKLRWPDFRSDLLGYYVGYHYLIEANGQITQTREDYEEGAHTIGYNQKSIGICLTGNFDLEEPSLLQLNALQPLLDRLKVQYNISSDKILGHCQVSATRCPGRRLLRWLNIYKQLSLLQRVLELLKQLFKGRGIS